MEELQVLEMEKLLTEWEFFLAARQKGATTRFGIAKQRKLINLIKEFKSWKQQD